MIILQSMLFNIHRWTRNFKRHELASDICVINICYHTSTTYVWCMIMLAIKSACWIASLRSIQYGWRIELHRNAQWWRIDDYCYAFLSSPLIWLHIVRFDCFLSLSLSFIVDVVALASCSRLSHLWSTSSMLWIACNRRPLPSAVDYNRRNQTSTMSTWHICAPMPAEANRIGFDRSGAQYRVHN